MYDTPEDHNHEGMLPHDPPWSSCPGGCGWPDANCHCQSVF